MVILLKRNIKNVAGNKLVQMEYRQNTCILSNLQKSLWRWLSKADSNACLKNKKKKNEKKSAFEKLSAYWYRQFNVGGL